MMCLMTTDGSVSAIVDISRQLVSGIFQPEAFTFACAAFYH
jgi:hypothetical protein